MTHKPPLTVVLPSHNNGEVIPRTVKEILKVSPYGTEIIVVVDGSDDGSDHIIRNLCGRDTNVRAIFHPRRQGKGVTVKDGMLAARGKLVAFTDADMVIHPKYLRAMYDVMAKNESFVIAIGHRMSYEARFLRKILHSIYKWMNTFLFGFPFWDTQVGLKMFRAPVARQLFSQLRTDGYAFDVEILVMALRKRLRVQEVAVKQVRGDYSSMSLQSMALMMKDTMRLYRDIVRKHLRHRSAISGKHNITKLTLSLLKYGPPYLFSEIIFFVASMAIVLLHSLQQLSRERPRHPAHLSREQIFCHST